MNKTVKYIRVSSQEQNIDRQLDNRFKCYIDRCSGSIPFKDRTVGGRILDHLDKGDTLLIHDIDRLGRNLKDILETVEELHKKEVSLKIEKLGIESLIEGRVNTAFQLILSVLGTVAEMDRNQILERQKEGISIAKAKGKYKGTPHGSRMNVEKWKAKNNDIITGLKKGLKFREIIEMTGRSKSQIQKVKKRLIELNALH